MKSLWKFIDSSSINIERIFKLHCIYSKGMLYLILKRAGLAVSYLIDAPFT